MRKFVWLLLLASSIINLLSGCSNMQSNVPDPHVQLSSSCNAHTGYYICSVILTNDAQSSQDFNWKVSVQPGTIEMGITSGTVTPGGKNELQFHVLPGECPFTMTFTGSTGVVIKTGVIRCSK